jgi:hypothetical protein
MKKLKISVLIGFLICMFGAFLCLTGCNEETIAAPTKLNIDIELTLTWDKVDAARSYQIEVTNDEGTVVVDKKEKKTYTSLKSLEMGLYSVRVKALGRSEGVESAWTEAISFDRPYDSGCVYTLLNNQEYEVTRAGTASGEVVIEDVYRGKPVTSIAANAFKGNTRITSIVLGANVKTIGENAFYRCESLESIALPESLVSIGAKAFQRCISLEEVTIPSKITVINESTFTLCKSLKKLTIGENVQYIGESAFSDCYGLTTITIPDSVVSIADYAFSAIEELQTLTIGKKVQSIGNFAFQLCAKLEKVTFNEDGELTYIGKRAFYQDVKLDNLGLPKKLQNIDQQAFYYCQNLETVDLPDSLMKVGNAAFHETKLYKAQLEAEEKLIYLDKWIIGVEDSLYETVQGIATEELEDLDTLVIKPGTIGISGGVFTMFKALQIVKMPASVKYIGDETFAYCDNLYRVDLINTELIGDYAFFGCGMLMTFAPGNKLVEIGDYAFYACKNLSGFNAPDTVRKIGTYAFNKTKIWTNAESNAGSQLVYVGNWVVGLANPYTTTVTLREGTIGVADYAFYNCLALNSINLMGVRYLGRAAFYECMSLEMVQFDSNLQEIDDYTFYGCSRLRTIMEDFPRQLRSIGRSAFYNCLNLVNVDLSKTKVAYIGPYAFYGCESLLTLDLGEYLQAIDLLAFYKCSVLEELRLPDTMVAIGDRAFYKNIALKTIDFGTGLASIGQYAFAGCEAVTEIKLPDATRYA